jgi:hypothetical protein
VNVSPPASTPSSDDKAETSAPARK